MYNYQCFTPPTNEGVNSKRIGYIDALRGFVMLVVVFQHIRAFGFGLMENDSVLSMVYLTFMLPSFFLVSGFTSYKEKKYLQSITLMARFRQLVVPTIVFLIIHNFLGYDGWGFPGGYWFTYALFIIIMLNFAIQKFLPNKWYVPSLIVISVIFFGIRGIVGSRLDYGWYYYISLRAVLTFFQYYTLGVILKIHYERVLKLFSKSFLRNVIILTTVVGFLLSEWLSGILPSALYSIYDNILGFIATFMVFMTFYLFRSIFECGNLIAKSMNYVGKRTLDLYMLHYFFIPSLLSYGYIFKSTGNSCLELGVVGVLTIIITIISLTLSKILKVSPLVSYWLFGGKKYNNSTQINN